jgi:gas vesicle protein
MSKECCESSGGCHCGTNGIWLFLGGALVGAALGVLFAPYEGRHTRRRIGKSVADLKDKAVRKFDDLVDTAENVVDDLKDVANDLKNSVTEKVEKFKTTHHSGDSADPKEA